VPETTYHMVSTVEEALGKARELNGDFCYLAGGTDLQILRQQRLVRQSHVIDISRVEELRTVHADETGLTLGAMITLDELVKHPVIKRKYPLLITAARSIATPVIRKTATVGGNLLLKNRCSFYNQSYDWRQAIGSCLRDHGDICQVVGTGKNCYSRNVSDLAPALIALGAQAEIRDPTDRVTVPLLELYSGDGIENHQYINNNNGILTTIRIPARNGQSWFRKLRLRRSVDFTSLTVAIVWDQRRVRIGINGASMAPVLIRENLSGLSLENLQRQARKKCRFVDNDLLPLQYRRDMLQVYLQEWWDQRNQAAL